MIWRTLLTIGSLLVLHEARSVIGQMKQNTQKGKGKRIERKRKASLICPWFACSGPPWPFHLGASCPARPPAWYNITGWGRQQRQSRSHCGFSWFSFKIQKKGSSLLFPPDPKVQLMKMGRIAILPLLLLLSSSGIIVIQGKDLLVQLFFSDCPIQFIEWDRREEWVPMLSQGDDHLVNHHGDHLAWPGDLVVITWWAVDDHLLICWWRNLPKNACSTFTSPPPTVCDGECGEASAQLLQALHKGGSMLFYIKCY